MTTNVASRAAHAPRTLVAQNSFNGDLQKAQSQFNTLSKQHDANALALGKMCGINPELLKFRDSKGNLRPTNAKFSYASSADYADVPRDAGTALAVCEAKKFSDDPIKSTFVERSSFAWTSLARAQDGLATLRRSKNPKLLQNVFQRLQEAAEGLGLAGSARNNMK